MRDVGRYIKDARDFLFLLFQKHFAFVKSQKKKYIYLYFLNKNSTCYYFLGGGRFPSWMNWIVVERDLLFKVTGFLKDRCFCEHLNLYTVSFSDEKLEIVSRVSYTAVVQAFTDWKLSIKESMLHC